MVFKFKKKLKVKAFYTLSIKNICFATTLYIHTIKNLSLSAVTVNFEYKLGFQAKLFLS